MPDLTNRLSWSNSRYSSFRECARQYYWRAFGSWGGWDRAKAPPEAWKAYVFNKMKNLPMLIGEIVHHEIERVFKAHREGRKPPALELSETTIRNRLRQSWRESKERRWESSPKNYQNLSEHYYGPEPDREACERMREEAFQAMRNFLALPLVEKILSSPPESIRTVEKLEEFSLNGEVLHIKIDLAWHDGAQLHLIDWKTGARDDAVEDQLAAYALYAGLTWNLRCDQMQGYAVYLKDGRVGENCLSDARVDALKETIRAYFSDVRGRLADPSRLIAKLDDFPLTEELWKCKRCFYRELCGR